MDICVHWGLLERPRCRSDKFLEMDLCTHPPAPRREARGPLRCQGHGRYNGWPTLRRCRHWCHHRLLLLLLLLLLLGLLVVLVMLLGLRRVLLRLMLLLLLSALTLAAQVLFEEWPYVCSARRTGCFP